MKTYRSKREFEAEFQPPKMLIAGGGMGKGSEEGSGGTPEEDEDTLLSKQFAHIIDVWGEGQIEGWVHTDFPLLDIFLDGTPAQNSDSWGILSNGNCTAGSKVFTTTGGAEFEVFRNKNGVIKPGKTPMKGRWINEVGHAHIPFGASIESVEGAHSCTLDRPATTSGTGISWQLGGSVNFKGFSYQVRTGTQSQIPMQGFPAVEATFGVGTPLLGVGPPWSHTFYDSSLDACRVDIEFRVMQETNTETGDIHGSKVRIQFFLNGNMIINDLVVGKCSSPYIRTYKIPFEGYATPWTVTARRTTEDSHSQAIRNPTFVSSYTEVTYGKLSYPNTAMIGVKVNAKQFSSIPSRAYHIKGLKVKIPNNYDPITRNYTGVWSGTFSAPTWTNNPAWCWYDMVTNNRYGLGHMLVEAGLDKFALYTIARYCDAVDGSGNYVGVPSGKPGVNEPRFACNLYIQRHEDAIKVLQDMAGIFRAMLCYYNGIVLPIQDAPTDPSTYRMFSPANVIDGRFAYAGTGLRARHNVAVVSWSDLTDVGALKQEYVEDHDGITKAGGINQLDLTGFGCTSRGQARRIGLWAIYAEKILNDTITFGTSLEGYFVPPGKIIQIQDPFRAGDVLSGRLQEVGNTPTHLYLDRSVVISSGKVYFVGLIKQTTGELEVKQVTQANGTWNDITCNAFSFTPEKDALFQLAKYEVDAVTPALVPELARVLGVTMKEENILEVVALKYNASLYDFVDFDHPLEDPPISQLPPSGTVEPPTNFESAVIVIIRPDNSIIQELVVAWNESPDQYLAHYRPTYRLNNGNWTGRRGQFDTDSNEFRIRNPPVGEYEFEIFAVNTIGAVSIPLRGEETVETPPTNITGITRLEIFGGNNWNPPHTRVLFQTRDAHFVWGVQSGNLPEVPFGDGPLEVGLPDAMADRFHVEIYNDDDKIWEEDPHSSEYIFTWEKNVQAVEDYYGVGYGPIRIFRIEVRVVFDDNTMSLPARLTVENPLPPPPLDVVTQTGNGYIAWQWTIPNAPDIEKFGLYASLEVDPEDPPQVAEFFGTSGIYYPPIGTWHYWLGTIDSFGNVSANVPQGPPPSSQVLPPVFHPPAGTYELDPGVNYLRVTITEATQDCYIMYALVPIGTNPTTFTLFTGTPIQVTGQKTLYAVAYKIHPPWDSNHTEGNYYVNGYVPPNPPPQPAPPNDNFANRILIAGVYGGPKHGSTVGASIEVSEPTRSPENVDRTVWYEWVGVTTGKLMGFWTNAATVVIEAFTGVAVSGLTLVAKSTTYLGGQLLLFTQTASTSYKIRVRPTAAVPAGASFSFVWAIPQCSTPEFDPDPGFYQIEYPERRFEVTATTATTTISTYLFWTFDGSTPTYDANYFPTGTTESIRRYVKTFTFLQGSYAIKMLAAAPGYLDSSVASVQYLLAQTLGPPCAEPYTDPPQGAFEQFPVSVQVLCDDPDGGSLETIATEEITGLKMWLKADSISAGDEDLIDLWTDSSGNGKHVAEAVSKPMYKLNVLNGKPVLRFTAAETMLMTGVSSLSITQPNTIVAVFKQTSKSSQGRVFDMPVGTRQLIGFTQTNGFFDCYAGTSSLNDSKDHSGAFHIQMVVFNGASTVGYLDGKVVVTGNPGSQGLSGAPYIGTDGSGAYLTGDIAEIMIYDHALTTDEREQVLAYLNNKYFIVQDSGSELPSASEVPETVETAIIKYTINGQIPSRNGPGIVVVAGQNISIPHPCRLKMVAYTRGREESSVVVSRFLLAGRIPTPTFNPPAGRYPAFPVAVTIFVPPQGGINLRYTTDGSTPTPTNGTLIASNTGIASVTAPNKMLQAVAFGDGYITSSVGKATYTGKINAPTHDPDSIFYLAGSTENVTVDCDSGLGSFATNLVSRWTMNETSGTRNDSYGTNHLTDNATVGFAAGITGNAAQFIRANSEFLSRASNSTLQVTGDFTFAAWIKLNAVTNTYSLVTKDTDSPASSRDYTLDWEPTAGFRFYVAYDGNPLRICTTGLAGFNTTGVWYFIVAWYDSVDGKLRMRINDTTTFVATTGVVSLQQSAAEFRIGARQYAGFNDFADVDIDEVWFWKRVLTSPEITTLYASGGSPSLAIQGRYTTDGTIPSRTIGTLISFPTVVGISGGYRELRTIAFAVDSKAGYSDSEIKLSTYDWIEPLPP